MLRNSATVCATSGSTIPPNKTAVRRKTKTTYRLLRDSATTGANSSKTEIRSEIAQLFGRFASEKRGEWTGVLDPSGERSKARESKRVRSVNTKKESRCTAQRQHDVQ